MATPVTTTDEPLTETYREWRLTGQPDGPFPFYDCTFRDDERTEALKLIWAKIKTGEYAWTNAQLQTREVTIARTPWRDEDADDHS